MSERASGRGLSVQLTSLSTTSLSVHIANHRHGNPSLFLVQVLTRDSQLGPKFPSRVISLVAEKFSPVKDSRNLNKKDTKRTGRRMVAEELKFRRVDVKERQQRFESMADMKDSRVCYIVLSRGFSFAGAP